MQLDDATARIGRGATIGRLDPRLARDSSNGTRRMALFKAQLSSGNLDSSSKFSLGGPAGVRAYPVGEGSGDQGLQLSLEARRAMGASGTGLAFFDLGGVLHF